jgi:hypothetical protein
MTNPFATSELNKSLSNYPVLKGDVEGHPFRGNQWKAAADAEALADKPLPVGELTPAQPTIGHITNNLKDYYSTMAKGHADLADTHIKIASGLRSKVDATSGDRDRANKNAAAAAAHLKAAELYQRMANKTNLLDSPDEHAKLVARSLTLAAAVASNIADNGYSHLVDPSNNA